MFRLATNFTDFVSRDENPVGTWTLKVTDPENPELNGTFVGWNMILWGSAIDADRATLYELPPDDEVFPPVKSDGDGETPTTTTMYTKPTEHLPDDHGEAEGENTKAAFGSATASPTSTPYGDSGWIPGMAAMTSGRKWFIGSLVIVALFGIGVGIFFWRRKVAQRQKQANYSSLPAGESVSMSALDQGGTRELYDAFGEISDDEDAELLKDSDREGRYHDEPESRSSPRSDSNTEGSWVHTSS